MSNLVMLVVTIVLMGVFAAVTMDYLGSDINSQGKDAIKVGIEGNLQQVNNALKIASLRSGGIPSDFDPNSTDPDVNFLLGQKYLTTMPDVAAGGSWAVSGNNLSYRVPDTGTSIALLVLEESCYDMNAAAGYTYISTDPDVHAMSFDNTKYAPLCTMAGLPDGVPCCYEAP